MLSLAHFKIIATVLAVVIAIGFVSCSKTTPSKPISEGSYYAVKRDGKSGFKILKILKVDEQGYHIRLYSNIYQKIPKSIDVASLKMVGFDEQNEQQDLGMGHLPISKQNFIQWGAIFIQTGTVDESELEGYQIWKEANGGYF